MYLINCQLHDFEVGFTKVICSSNPLRCQAASGVQKDREEIKPHNEEHEFTGLSSPLSIPSLPQTLGARHSTRNPAVLWHLCLDISTQTHHGWLLGSDNTLPNGTQAEAKISDFLHHLKFRLPKKFSFLKLWTDTLL